MAHFGRLRRTTLLPAALVLRSYCPTCEILGHVQFHLLVNYHYRHRCCSQLYWSCHLSTTAWGVRSHHSPKLCFHHSDVVQSTVSISVSKPETSSDADRQRTILPNYRLPSRQLFRCHRRTTDVLGYRSSRQRLNPRLSGYLPIHRIFLSRLHPSCLVLAT